VTVVSWPLGTALLVTRATPRQDYAAQFDAWQATKHLPELIAAPGAHSLLYAEADPTQRSAAFAGCATRLAIYSSASLASMLTFVGSDAVAEAVADGSQWFGCFRDLDGEPYSGNVYSVFGAWGVGFESAELLLIERLEIPTNLLGLYDEWIETEYAPGLMRSDGVSGVRACRVHRDGVSVPYYHSRGNRAVLVAFRLGVRHEDAPFDAAAQENFASSRLWDLRIPYAEREIFEVRMRLPHESTP
jgi:hypothetical protein